MLGLVIQASGFFPFTEILHGRVIDGHMKTLYFTFCFKRS